MSLQGDVIRLANEKPEFRPTLVPLLREAASVRMVAKTPKAVQSWFMENTLQRGQLLTVWVGRGRDDYFEVQITGVELWPPLDKPRMWPREPNVGTSMHKDTYAYKSLGEPSYPGERQTGDLTVRGLRMGGVAVEINGQRVFKLGLGAEGRMASDKTGQGRFTVGPGGLEKPKKVKLKPNTIHYMGASSSPSLIIVTKADDKTVEFLDDSGSKRREQAWVAEDLISRGDATWLKTYASYVTKYEDWKKVQPGSKVNPKKFFRDKEPMTVLVEAVAPANKFPRNDPWYGAEEYGGVGGLEQDDGSYQYEISTTQGRLDKLKKDKRFKVVKEKKGRAHFSSQHEVPMSQLRQAIIRLANEKPEFRGHLVPILQKTSAKKTFEVGPYSEYGPAQEKAQKIKGDGGQVHPG